MILISAKVGPFKSINNAQLVRLDEDVTVLVGMNEAGKTIFLQALEKSNDALGLAKFNPVEDFPRKDLSAYLKRHKSKPEDVVELTYLLSDEELAEVNQKLLTNLTAGFSFSVTHHYGNSSRIGIDVDETSVISALSSDGKLSSEAKAAIAGQTSIRSIPAALKELSLTDEDKACVTSLEKRIVKVPKEWTSIIEWETWELLKKKLPKFLYFGDYQLLPSKMNLADLAQRVENAKNDPSVLKPKHQAVLALLRMADIAVADFTHAGGYEPLKAKIEGISINITDQIMEFWKQNENLEVEVDIKPDPNDEAPFNSGPNLYLRIKNRRHRGISTPFDQRSRGFIWFFSFLVWFDSVQHQLASVGDVGDHDLILLLDEPGLSLHALAQADFLKYIDKLSKKHQVVYTTHSPFMVHSDRLHQVRMVEDQAGIGTVISDNLTGTDPRTIFPLQAALGWSIAQNLFISERNLLVEGPSDLIYLKIVSAALDAQGRTALREDITIVPTGGLDKVATFVALLGANGLKLAVLHDYRGTPDQRLQDLVKEKIISSKVILNASQFLDHSNGSNGARHADTEDLLPTGLYLEHFSKAFKKQLGGKTITEADLPAGERIIERLERFLATNGIQIRPSGGFNHYSVASHIASNPPASLDAGTLNRFEALFKSVNALF